MIALEPWHIAAGIILSLILGYSVRGSGSSKEAEYQEKIDIELMRMEVERAIMGQYIAGGKDEFWHDLVRLAIRKQPISQIIDLEKLKERNKNTHGF